MSISIKPPYLLFLGEVSDARYAKTASGIHYWAKEVAPSAELRNSCKQEMLNSNFQRCTELHRLRCWVTYGKQLQVGHIAGRRPACSELCESQAAHFLPSVNCLP